MPACGTDHPLLIAGCQWSHAIFCGSSSLVSRRRSALGDCFADGGRDFACPEVQCRLADAVARTEQVDESGGGAFEHGESQFLYPLRHPAPDPAALVVAGLW